METHLGRVAGNIVKRCIRGGGTTRPAVISRGTWHTGFTHGPSNKNAHEPQGAGNMSLSTRTGSVVQCVRANAAKCRNITCGAVCIHLQLAGGLVRRVDMLAPLMFFFLTIDVLAGILSDTAPGVALAVQVAEA